jgi:peptidoglycan/xylan/chitin deacetylase (PgdA/CDA1 family)
VEYSIAISTSYTIYQISKKIHFFAIFLVISASAGAYSTSTSQAYASPEITEKAVILTFDDDWKNQYTQVKPILEEYGFKATFFITPGCASYQNHSYCNNSSGDGSSMTWEDIKSLQEDGYDIQSHGMRHKDLTKLSQADLEYEIAESKNQLLQHDINSTVFGNPFAAGQDNSTVIKTISKYYDMARAGYGKYAFLKCDLRDEGGIIVKTNQTDCRTYSNDGSLTLSNRYSLSVFSHYGLDNTYEHDESKILEEFAKVIDDQANFNDQGDINAIPIITYHNIDNIDGNVDPGWIDSTTDLDLFEEEMEYLYDNDITVLDMNDLEYNQSSNHIYIKDGS